MNKPEPMRILIVKLSAIGDVLMATPVARALRQAFPDSYIAWVVERKSADVVLGNPYIDDVIVWERVKSGSATRDCFSNYSGFMELRHRLREKRFDIAIDLQGLMRSAIVCKASGAPMRVGFTDAGEAAWLFYTHKYDPGKEILVAQQRNLDLLKPLGVHSTDTAMHMPLIEDDRDFAASFFKANGLTGTKVVTFLPATTWVNKHWVTESWSQFADILVDKLGVTPLILGSKADLKLANEIANGSHGKLVIAAGQTTLKQAGAIMERCVAVVGVDTGLLHMAVALDKPCIGLFGASVWRCFIVKDNFSWIAKDFACSPCLRHPTCANVDCMRAITPEDVESAIVQLLT